MRITKIIDDEKGKQLATLHTHTLSFEIIQQRKWRRILADLLDLVVVVVVALHTIHIIICTWLLILRKKRDFFLYIVYIVAVLHSDVELQKFRTKADTSVIIYRPF